MEPVEPRDKASVQRVIAYSRASSVSGADGVLLLTFSRLPDSMWATLVISSFAHSGGDSLDDDGMADGMAGRSLITGAFPAHPPKSAWDSVADTPSISKKLRFDGVMVSDRNGPGRMA